MNILHVTSDTHYGGVQEVVLAICRNSSPGFNHSVLRITPGRLEDEFKRFATVLSAGLSFENSITEAIWRSAADVIHAHLPGGTCPPWLVSAHQTGVPIVEAIHCVYTALPEEEEIASARLVASEHAARLQRTREKLHIVPYPISVDGLEHELAPEAKAERRRERTSLLGIPEHGIAIGRLGNITPWKRVQDFIAVVPLILAWSKNRGVPISLSIAGSSHGNTGLLSELKALAGRLSVRDSIRFLGDQPNKYAHLSMLDVFLYPTSRETYCITAAEAMAMGLLVITYRESAMPETVGDAGILVEPGDFKALATAVVDFLQNPAAWQERRALASRIALERNHPRVVIPRYEAVYSSVAR